MPIAKNLAATETVTIANLNSIVFHSEKPVLLDFWAKWCIPCNLIKPAVENAAKILAEDVIFGLVDIDKEPDVATYFGIRGTPTFILINKGEVVHTFSGIITSRKLVDKIRYYLTKS